MVKAILVATALVAYGVGVPVTIIGLQRLGLPYEDGSYFDRTTATVYHQQAAEVYTGAGVVLLLAACALAIAAWKVKGSNPS